jgi:hypothetical protein
MPWVLSPPPSLLLWGVWPIGALILGSFHSPGVSLFWSFLSLRLFGLICIVTLQQSIYLTCFLLVDWLLGTMSGRLAWLGLVLVIL